MEVDEDYDNDEDEEKRMGGSGGAQQSATWRGDKRTAQNRGGGLEGKWRLVSFDITDKVNSSLELTRIRPSWECLGRSMHEILGSVDGLARSAPRNIVYEKISRGDIWDEDVRSDELYMRFAEAMKRYYATYVGGRVSIDPILALPGTKAKGGVNGE